ncbi:unnamed protein product [marine sediment metagenome]|uniref:Uncharacterized protein n=1 Tax=marine sediment metagenome TaxID=412755 RepID=X1I806_9ZZZZ
MAKKVVEPFNIHLDAFWEEDIPKVEKMLRKLNAESLKKLYGSTITITDKPMFPHPVTGEPMVGDTRYFRGKPYLIILGSKPTPRILYHEVAHYIGIDDETEAMEFAKQKEEFLKGGNPMKTETERKSFHERIFGKGSTPPLERLRRGETLNNMMPMSPDIGPPLPRMFNLKWPWKKD